MYILDYTEARMSYARYGVRINQIKSWLCQTGEISGVEVVIVMLVVENVVGKIGMRPKGACHSK